MSRLYWDTQFLSPFLVTTTMDHKSLKRSRSTESLNRSLKRSKPFENDSPISVASEPAPNTTNPLASTLPIVYPTHEQQQQQNQSFLKPISISTRTIYQAQEQVSSSSNYQNINGILHSAHVDRFGDPETRESWWQETGDIEMTDENENNISNNEYNSVNSVLRQAFLQRHSYLKQ